ncbi:maleylacetoacetate isomerase [Sphingobium sp. SCG-1]|nr:maleylacetoacetate isomerase [Sphingobium sp. SCG-1]
MPALHGYYRSSASYRLRIALNLKGIAYRDVPHHLRLDEQRAPQYLALNPQGMVPALEIGGRVLTQSLAICEYLEETIPESPLLPEAPTDRAKVRAMAQIIACDIHPIDNLRVLQYLRKTLGQDQAAVTAWYNHWIAEGFTALEAELRQTASRGPFCYGNAPGLIDLCLVPQVYNAGNFALDLTPFGRIREVNAACVALPAFERAHPANQPDAE